MHREPEHVLPDVGNETKRNRVVPNQVVVEDEERRHIYVKYTAARLLLLPLVCINTGGLAFFTGCSLLLIGQADCSFRLGCVHPPHPSLPRIRDESMRRLSLRMKDGFPRPLFHPQPPALPEGFFFVWWAN